MKFLDRIESYGSWIAMACLCVFAAMATDVAVAGIANTKHNLVGTTNTNRVTVGTDEICGFCHTPHAGQASALGAPLWNKALPTVDGTYTLYSSTTMDGTANFTGSS